MNSRQIMSDLAASAARFGVEVLLGFTVDAESIQVAKYGEPDTVSGVIATSETGGRFIHVVARQYVFALGAGFDELNFLKDRLDLRVKVQRTTSVMVVTKPALCRQSFVTVAESPQDTLQPSI